jgi:hypothetical protein
MTTKADYTDTEWASLLQSPVYAGMYIMYADPNITGMIGEMKAMFKAVKDQPVPEAAQDLVGSLVADIKEKSENKEQLPGAEESPQGGAEEIKAQMLENVRGVAGTLDAKAAPEEADGFKEWLVGVAQAVAGEKGALEELNSALGLSTT